MSNKVYVLLVGSDPVAVYGSLKSGMKAMDKMSDIRQQMHASYNVKLIPSVVVK
jgi:hypothetical protein